jgi:hypothetical protein
VVVLVAIAGCGFQHGGLMSSSSDDAMSGDDADLPNAIDPFHLGPGDGLPGTGALVLTGSVAIDTSIPLIKGMTLPAGVTFDVRPQLGGGPDLAVLHVATLDVQGGAMVRIVGTRPLVIVASGVVTVSGVLDAGAHGVDAGAGGSLPATGDGAGQHGNHETSNQSDSGGGGAGYGNAGAAGGAITGTCTATAGAAGVMYGDAAITRLIGGSGGGTNSGTQCTPDLGGAGGGALQLTSAMSISITGTVLASGGGGRGSTDCGQSDVNSGAGGGSGGAIVLQAPAIMLGGVVAANGGGGGGSSSTGSGNANPGDDGGAGSAQANGGTGPRAAGGKGGSASGDPTAGGGSTCGTNGGGGGGAAGRIAIAGTLTSTGVVSPAAALL